MTSTRKLTCAFDEKAVDALFAQFNQCHLPGAAVGVAIHGRPVYRKGFGLASMELPLVLSPNTRMRIGSTTKQFTALAYLLLCEAGKAGIDDPVGKFFPEFHPVSQPATMRQLMGNTSGLRDVYDACFLFSGHPPSLTSAECLQLYRTIDDVNAPPGTTWNYNNGGWEILSAAIERIADKPFEDVLRELVFDPIGMYDTMLRRWDTGFVPGSATPHAMSAAGRFEKSYWSEFVGSGGMVSTVNDLLRWLAHMDSPRVGNEATWALMKTPRILPNGTSTGYGSGLITTRYRGVEMYEHSGNWVGGNAQALKVPAAGLDVVVAVNRNDTLGLLLANQILDACLSGLDPVRESPNGPFTTGTFHSPATGRTIQLSQAEVSFPFFTQRQAVQIVSIDGTDLPMAPDSDGVLYPMGQCSLYKQSVTLVGDRERPAALRFSDFGNLDELVAVKSAQKPRLGSRAGRYRCDGIDTEVTITEDSDGPQLSSITRFGSATYDLEPLSDRLWRVRPPRSNPKTRVAGRGVLSFDSDGPGFRLSAVQTRSLVFRRIA